MEPSARLWRTQLNRITFSAAALCAAAAEATERRPLQEAEVRTAREVFLRRAGRDITAPTADYDDVRVSVTPEGRTTTTAADTQESVCLSRVCVCVSLCVSVCVCKCVSVCDTHTVLC